MAENLLLYQTLNDFYTSEGGDGTVELTGNFDIIYREVGEPENRTYSITYDTANREILAYSVDEFTVELLEPASVVLEHGDYVCFNDDEEDFAGLYQPTNITGTAEYNGYNCSYRVFTAKTGNGSFSAITEFRSGSTVLSEAKDGYETVESDFLNDDAYFILKVNEMNKPYITSVVPGVGYVLETEEVFYNEVNPTPVFQVARDLVPASLSSFEECNPQGSAFLFNDVLPGMSEVNYTPRLNIMDFVDAQLDVENSNEYSSAYTMTVKRPFVVDMFFYDSGTTEKEEGHMLLLNPGDIFSFGWDPSDRNGVTCQWEITFPDHYVIIFTQYDEGNWYIDWYNGTIG